MKKIFLFFVLASAYVSANACTNFIVGKKASADGSVMVSYSADSYGAYMKMAHYAPGLHQKDEMRKIYDWDTNRYWGEIPEAHETYNVLGNINEHQVSIAETTFGGREEMADSTGIMDYGSLIYVALQRSKSAREAIKVMTTLAETYGYNSEGETFSICDPNEAWIMEMMGQGAGSKKVVWVAVRIPDDAVCAHANQSRIRTFNQKDKENVMFSKDCIKYARKMGWFTGKDADFSFRDAYAKPDFGGRRFCDARVWSLFNHFVDMMPYVDYAEGKKPLEECEEMPLWIKPDRKVSVRDVQNLMRDHYEGTPFALDTDMGEGLWQMPYRPTPLSFKVDGKKYFNERPVSTQQSAFTFVSQLRSWLPRQIGGIIWFGNDDANMVSFVPVYCGNVAPPACFNDPKADDITFSENSAFWVCNWVSNMIYPRYAQMFPELEKVRDAMDEKFEQQQAATEAEAMNRYSQSENDAVKYLTNYSNTQAAYMLDTWKNLAYHLIVKFNDMAEKPEVNGEFTRSKYGLGATVKRPGYPERAAKRLVESTGDKFASPEE